MKITINANALASVRGFQAVKGPRYYLCGIRVERAPDGTPGCFIVATDGHRMAVVYDQDACMESYAASSVILTMDKTDLTKMAKAPCSMQAVIEFEETKGIPPEAPTVGTVSFGSTLARVGWQGGRYPMWREVVPRPIEGECEPNARVGVDINLLKPLADLFPKKGKDRSVATQRFTETGAILVTRASHPNRFAVIMPTREGFDLPSIPSIDFSQR